MIHILTLKRKTKIFHGLSGIRFDMARLYIVRGTGGFDSYYLGGRRTTLESLQLLSGDWVFCLEHSL
jgi:hypothetical protein